MVKIEFLKDFATFNKGEAWDCDSMLASSLIRRKVAKKSKEAAKEVKPKRVRRTKEQIEADKNKE
jgi:hypothetical protein